MDLFLCFQCLGADVVFDKLGLDVHVDAAADQLDHIAALIVVELIEGL